MAFYVADNATLSPENPPPPGTPPSQMSASRQIELIEDCLSECDVVVLSQEDWRGEAHLLGSTDITSGPLRRYFQDCGISVETVLYVRPQVGWFASAYLQWGIWQGLDIEDYVERDGWYADWSSAVDDLLAIGLPTVNVRYAEDVVSDFATGVLGLDSPYVPSLGVNRAVPWDFLRLMARNTGLRPSQHDSLVEGVFAQLAPSLVLGRPVPAFIGEDLAAKIDERFARSNQDLRDSMGAEQFTAYQSRLKKDRIAARDARTLRREALLAAAPDPSFLEELASIALMYLARSAPTSDITEQFTVLRQEADGLRCQIASLDNANASLDNANDALRLELAAIHSSRSWVATAPLRRLGLLIRSGIRVVRSACRWPAGR